MADSRGATKGWFAASYPRISTGLPRPETVALFGCWLADRRIAADAETAELARLAGRSPEWVASIEAGQCVPSPAGFEDLRLAFQKEELRLPVGTNDHDDADLETGGSGTALPDVVDPARVAQALELDPWGFESNRLREKFGLQPREAAPAGDHTGDGMLVPLLEEIRHRDRLLTLTPLLGLATTGGLLWAGKPWRADPAFEWPNFDAVAFLGLAAVALSAIFIPSIARAFDGLLRFLRFGKIKKYYDNCKAIRDDEGTQLDLHAGWYRPGESPYLLPSLRDRCRALSVEADISERLLVVFIVGAVAVSGSLQAAFAAGAGAGWSSHWPWIIGGLATIIISLRMWQRLRGLSVAACDALNDAYGEPTPTSVEG